MLRGHCATFTCALLVGCGMAEQVREEPWRMGMTPTNRYLALFDTNYNSGMRWFYRKDYDSAILAFTQAYDAAERHRLESEKAGFSQNLARSNLANVLRALGTTRQEQRRYAEAEANYRRGMQIREGLHGPDSRQVADFLNDLAVNYRKQGRYDDALPLLERATRIFEATGNRFDLAVVLNNIGHVRAGQQRAAEAEASFGRALATTEEAMGRNRGPDHPGWFARILQIKDYAAALRRSGSAAQAEPLEAQLKDLVGEEKNYAAALRGRGQAEVAGFREARLAGILSD